VSVLSDDRNDVGIFVYVYRQTPDWRHVVTQYNHRSEQRSAHHTAMSEHTAIQLQPLISTENRLMTHCFKYWLYSTICICDYTCVPCAYTQRIQCRTVHKITVCMHSAMHFYIPFSTETDVFLSLLDQPQSLFLRYMWCYLPIFIVTWFYFVSLPRFIHSITI